MGRGGQNGQKGRIVMNPRKRLLGSLLAGAVSLCLAACGGPAAPDTASPAPSAPAASTPAAHGKEDVIVLAGARTLAPGVEDVYFSHKLLGAWEPLISADETGSPVGVLAERWQRNEDATAWTFYLRQGVRFQNGEAFNADIVVENFKRYQMLENGYSRYTSFRVADLYPGLIGCEKVDDYTVTVRFEQPVPRLLFNMKDYASCIFCPGSWDPETGCFTEQPVGTGPYVITEVKEDEYAVLKAFDGYWGEPAKTENIRVRVISDPQARYAALDSEEVMGVLDLGAMPAALGDELLKDSRFAMAVHTSNITHFMLLKGEGTPFSDVRLRQAVSLAIDRQLIVDQLWGGYAKPTQNLINRMCPDWVELPVEYDMDRAKELAREVLGEQRIQVDMYTRSLYLDRGPYKEMMEYIQSQLAQIGIDATVNIIDSSTYSEMSENGELGANFMTHGMANLNAYLFLNMYLGSEGSYNQSQHLAYHNEYADGLLTEMRGTLDDGRFHALAVELQEIANTQLPVIPLFYDTSNLIYNREQITGYEDFTDHVDLSHLAWVGGV